MVDQNMSAADCLDELYQLEFEMEDVQKRMNSYVQEARSKEDYEKYKPQIESFYRS